MSDSRTPRPDPSATTPAPEASPPAAPGAGGGTAAAKLPKEIGGAPGPEPTRYGDWQHKGRVTDF